MLCPKCKSKSSVTRTIFKRKFTDRYRICNNKNCKFKFKTKEQINYGYDYQAIIKNIKNMLREVK